MESKKSKKHREACRAKVADGYINTASGDWIKRGSFGSLPGANTTTPADHYFHGYKLGNVA